jgi:hypothetical protein
MLFYLSCLYTIHSSERLDELCLQIYCKLSILKLGVRVTWTYLDRTYDVIQKHLAERSVAPVSSKEKNVSEIFSVSVIRVDVENDGKPLIYTYISMSVRCLIPFRRERAARNCAVNTPALDLSPSHIITCHNNIWSWLYPLTELRLYVTQWLNDGTSHLRGTFGERCRSTADFYRATYKKHRSSYYTKEETDRGGYFTVTTNEMIHDQQVRRKVQDKEGSHSD